MTHNLDLSTGKPAIAYVGKEPWHGLGQKLTPNATIEEWIVEAQLVWQIERVPVYYFFKDEYRIVSDRHVLVRSDDGKALSVVSDDYKIVQPKEVLEFYRSLVENSAFMLETAGALDGGRKVWALAKSNHHRSVLENDKEDDLKAYLLFATSNDKTLATTVAFTSIRVVCQNTLQFAMQDIKGQAPTRCIKVAHNLRFKPDEVKEKLGLIDESWNKFIGKVRQLSQAKIDDEKERQDFFKSLFISENSKKKELSNKAITEVQNLQSIFSNAAGQSRLATKNTAWGLVNAVTFYVDHQRKHNSQSSRLDSAWFGAGAQLKEKAWNMAMERYYTIPSSLHINAPLLYE